jgi:RNA exonuclease 1
MTILMQLKKKEPEAAKAVTSKTMANDGDDGGMDATFLNTLVLTESQLDAMQYPPRTLLDRPTPASTKDQQRTCDRCKKPFTVKAILDAKDVKACQYHFGRLRVSQSFGEKLRTYTCCDDTLGSLGCEKGPHVFKGIV